MSSWGEQPHPDDPRSELGNDGLTDEERAAGIAPLFEKPMLIDTGNDVPQCSMEECAVGGWHYHIETPDGSEIVRTKPPVG